ncbi:YigZ family protein [Petrocella sp. FN5]|uniref:YigZ family protein n=1 Tax=Petrocella sp. FN5 TaxID=3032002 RepID=UPI0023DA42EE|nr:YigZ family protein [Petrocella sp. FN5]MDF1618076.1 YigZ family protein [Petrocella sp. FN5]
MLKVYKTIRQEASKELVEHKSRFVGHILKATSEEEAKNIITTISKQHRDANHNCYAYRINGTQLVEKYSDDGEPSQTAGMPMLDLLRTKDLVNVVAVVTRYFGGVKLGTGGLVRAYTKTLQTALDQVAIISKDTYSLLKIRVPYTYAGKLDYYIQKEAIVVKDTQYEEEVYYELYTTNENDLRLALVELTNGQSIIKKLGEVIGFIERGKMYEE